MDFFQTFWSPSDLPSVPLSKIPNFSFNQTFMRTMCSKSNYSTPKWWKEAVVYQVIPASFNCGKPTIKTNGWGDVTVRMSPQVDMGYDIADYKPSPRIHFIILQYEHRLHSAVRPVAMST
ncbi:hypothetical protein BO83DRAFT_120148 [Aspergillus eucalypticola CBS 122712]|uniref:Uncharacterized protein n=1 Tax=Aspergillus eucalypticola (strain CBS 122712 / IBT 29274) TaxID=1448314 RepID=A0A317UY99_ASPEC|nr:uncharacterized protein BO83DRAFT_120148 [Aspergillus eucalypticola CBS 122712]PWY65472.1 hypothetical protein BO83DRAFT_120148 [Aspergillus eucalypticola CBS 122712]